MSETIVALGSVLLSLLLFCAFVAGTAWLAWWMLEPINRVAGVLQATTRFMLTDVIGLMILLQIGLALIGRALAGNEVRREAVVTYWVLVGAVALLVTVLWAASVSVVSRAGITRPLRRIVVMVLLVPGTLAVMVSLPAALLFVLVASVSTVLYEQGPPAFVLALSALAFLALAAAAFAMRWLSFWSLTGSPGANLLEIESRRASG
jgi:hypothetical protein